MAADAVACEKNEGCPLTAVAIAKSPKWDPCVVGPINTILHCIAIVQQWEGQGIQWGRDYKERK
eukprot:5058857-Karenia_brevis.AAC.1